MSVQQSIFKITIYHRPRTSRQLLINAQNRIRVLARLHEEKNLKSPISLQTSVMVCTCQRSQLSVLFFNGFFSLTCNGHCSCPLALCSSSLTIQINNSANLYVICTYSRDLDHDSCQKYTRKLTCLTHCISGINLKSERVLGKYLHFFSLTASLTQRVKKPNLQISCSWGNIHLIWAHPSSGDINWQPTQKVSKPNSIKGRGGE